MGKCGSLYGMVEGIGRRWDKRGSIWVIWVVVGMGISVFR